MNLVQLSHGTNPGQQLHGKEPPTQPSTTFYVYTVCVVTPADSVIKN